MEASLKYIRSSDWERGLSRLNEIWLESRCPRFAEEIGRLSKHASNWQGPLEGTGKALQTAWEIRAAQGNLVSVEHLLVCLRNGTVAQIRVRFRALLERAPDPRTGFFKLIIHTGERR